jgi:plastocyanin
MRLRVPGWAAIALTWVPFLLVLALFIADSAQQTAAQQPGAVSLHDNFFDPTTTDVVVGATVAWTNAGQGEHTVTSDTGVFDSGQEKSQRINPGQTFSFTFTQAGTYPYHCALHGAAGGVGMSGTVIVENASPASTTAAPQTGPPATVDLTITVTPAPATPTPAAVITTPTVQRPSNAVTPTISAPPGNPDSAAKGGGSDIVWILLVVGGATIGLGAAAAVVYRARSRRTR